MFDDSTDSGSEEAETAAAKSPMLRDPAEQEISPLELIFDVVFVLAVAQLAQDLVRNPTWRGAAETATLYVAVFAVWLATSWAATLYAPDHPRTRRMMISIMVAGLFMNVAITRAFDGGAWLFVTTYLGIQIGRTAWMLTTDLAKRTRTTTPGHSCGASRPPLCG